MSGKDEFLPDEAKREREKAVKTTRHNFVLHLTAKKDDKVEKNKKETGVKSVIYCY